MRNVSGGPFHVLMNVKNKGEKIAEVNFYWHTKKRKKCGVCIMCLQRFHIAMTRKTNTSTSGEKHLSRRIKV